MPELFHVLNNARMPPVRIPNVVRPHWVVLIVINYFYILKNSVKRPSGCQNKLAVAELFHVLNNVRMPPLRIPNVVSPHWVVVIVINYFYILKNSVKRPSGCQNKLAMAELFHVLNNVRMPPVRIPNVVWPHWVVVIVINYFYILKNSVKRPSGCQNKLAMV